MGKHSASPRVSAELNTPELSPASLISAATVDVRPRRLEEAAEVMPVMQSSSSANLRRSIKHGAVAAVASFAGLTSVMTVVGGSGDAPAAAMLRTSLDASYDESADEVPAALAGSDTAQMRSVANDIADEAQTAPMCNTEGATGLRAAYVSTGDTLVWPLMPGSYRLVSPFGSRVHPISHTIRMHNGQDMAGSRGTPVYAAADGVVDKVGSDGNNTVRIRHEINGEVFYTAYLHMYKGDIRVRVGQKVSAGERIGAIGSAGQSTGPHLHFETLNSSGTPVNPMSFMKSHGAVYLTQMCR